MEISSTVSPRSVAGDHLSKRGSDGCHREETELEMDDLESSDHGNSSNYQRVSTSALEILKETVWILRYNLYGFVSITALVICPVTAVQLSNLLVDQTIVKRLSWRLLLMAKMNGLPMSPFVKQSSYKFSEMAISSAVCFPLYITVSLLSKAAVVYSVDCTYSRKKFDAGKLYVIIGKIWRRVVMTYFWVCMLVVGCLTLFLVLLVAVCTTFSLLGFTPDVIVYPGLVWGLVFSVVFANCIIICNIAIVISVLEDVSGPQALLRSSVLIRGQTQVGLLIFLGSTIGMAFVEGLFEHRVKTLSYGDGSSRVWEGPLLVIMYSVVVLIDMMMSAVFYYRCKSYCLENGSEESPSVLESLAISSATTDSQ
uniref:Son of sevenless n=1 Tax=Kalanchoe fedtschenkoi TaxID=63787 RepID=A0A7N0V7N4_KALFE